MDYYQILKNYNDVLEPADIQEILMIGRNTAYHYLSKGLIKSMRKSKLRREILIMRKRQNFVMVNFLRLKSN